MGVCAGLYMYVVVVQKFTFAISSSDEFLFILQQRQYDAHCVSKKVSPWLAIILTYTIWLQ